MLVPTWKPYFLMLYCVDGIKKFLWYMILIATVFSLEDFVSGQENSRICRADLMVGSETLELPSTAFEILNDKNWLYLTS